MEVEVVMIPTSDGVGVNGGGRSFSTGERLCLGVEGNGGTLDVVACSGIELAGLVVGPRLALLDVAVGPPSIPEVRFRSLSEVALAVPFLVGVGALAVRAERLSNMTSMTPGHNRKPLIQGKLTRHHASWDHWPQVGYRL